MFNQHVARTIVLSTLACFVSASLPAVCQGQDGQLAGAQVAGNTKISQTAERLEMLVKSSRILTLDARIPRFQVHNEAILGATPVSENQLQIFAKMPGTTQVNMWDESEKLYTVDITITADAREVEGMLSTELPMATLKVRPINNSAIVSGYVTNVDDVDKAVAIVEQFYTTVVNNIKVVGVQQVLLHTRIMEVSRTKLRDLGVDFSAVDSAGNFLVNAPGNLINTPASSLIGGRAIPEADAAHSRIFTGEFETLIAALRRNDLIKFLAEPTVVATHGRPARFTVGGRLPYVVPSGDDAVTIAYEEFGTSVDFLPFVVGPGRIRLEVRPEVKEPDDSRAIEAAGIVVPAFSQRYVETAVELQAGQTFAIAGLLQSRTEANVRATPFFGELPYIGTMFRRMVERRNDIELLITVTPELVDAMDPHEVPYGPGTSSTSPNDNEFYLKGHLEVPNQKGGDGCNAQPFDTGMSLDPQISHTNNGFPTPQMQHSVPQGVVVPGTQPQAIGEGITISSPPSYTR